MLVLIHFWELTCVGSTGAVQRFQVACQNEKCQVQSPLTDKLDLSHSSALQGDKSN